MKSKTSGSLYIYFISALSAVLVLSMWVCNVHFLLSSSTSFSFYDSLENSMQSAAAAKDRILANCLKDNYIVYQPHYAGLGSNLVLGYTFAYTYASLLNRTLVFGTPKPGWLYVNKLPEDAAIDKRTAYEWEESANQNFWSQYFDHPVVTNPCVSVVNEISATEASSEDVLMDNTAKVITINLDQGPDYRGLYAKGKVRGIAVDENIISNWPSQRMIVKDLMKSLTFNVRVGILMRLFLMCHAYRLINPTESAGLNRYVAMHIRGGDKANEMALPDQNIYRTYIDKIENHVGKNISLFLAGDDQDTIEKIENQRQEGKTFRFPGLTLNPAKLAAPGSSNLLRCYHPCLINDILFDTFMISKADQFFLARGSGLSELAVRIEPTPRKAKHFVGISIEELDGKLKRNAKLIHSLRKDQIPKGFDNGAFLDPRTAWRREFRGGIIFENEQIAKLAVALLSIHPFLFLFLPNGVQDFVGDIWPDTISCDRFHAQSTIDATPSLGPNGMQNSCNSRPVQVMVTVESEEISALCSKTLMKGCRIIRDLDFIKKVDDFFTLIAEIQKQFGVPNILPEKSLLHQWWNMTVSFP